MKLKDTRDERVLEGEMIAMLPAGSLVSDQDMLRFYKLRPGHPNFDALARPCAHNRVVLRRGDTEDEHFYIVPRYDFYEEIT
jgi:hypothetical protein